MEIDKGAVTIKAEIGYLEGKYNNTKNILVQSANTDWIVETKIALSRTPAYVGDQAGMAAFANEDNFVKVVCKFSKGGFMGMTQIPRFEIITEIDGSGSTIASIPASEVIGTDNIFALRLKKEGSYYTAYYSSDAEHFTELGAADVILINVNLGLMAVKGQPSRRRSLPEQGLEISPVFTASFDYFRIESR